ncbi:autotransporter-associated beta strand repeat-containing protein [Luteolibacter ambystomatis]|uniref:Autotransporter-associated beta strand repeat-containing protein n=1 Tax=Luteolibacter ambystomatis TaxID=2824561 RepID=A0A975IYZ7_9BACT|nr:autotransporter-associated beta strand repeat-containing protein [Luteolibacter ambystomatis]QUE50941.1 autotransporter-associated beta strand repeat-containing protein [Luteolibacter ambystomatis]
MKLKKRALFVALGLILPASASTYNWQVAGTNDNWSTGGVDANWFVDAGTVLSPWVDANDAVFSAATGETVALNGTVAPTTTTVGSSNGSWTFSGTGVLGGTGTLVKNGTGTLTLANTTVNTYSGGTTISGGTLSIGTGGTGAATSTVGALGTGAVAINGGATLKLWIKNDNAATAPWTFANAINIDGGNILNEDGISTVSGAVTVGASGATFRSKWNGKALKLSGVISGAGAVTAARAADGGGEAGATVILSGASTYSGGTTVASGTLQLGDNAATDYGGTGRIVGTLTANTGTTVILAGSNVFGYNTGAKVNAVNLNGATLNHTGSADNGWGVAYTLTGATMQTTVAGGRFSFGNNTSVTTVASANASTISGQINFRENNTGNTVPFNVDDGAAATDLLVNANIQGGAVGLTKSGTGTMVLNGANTFTGPSTINAGSLVLGSGGSLASSAVTVNTGAGFQVAATGKTLPALTANGTTTLGLAARTAATTTVTGAVTFGAGAATTVNVLPLNVLQVGQVYDLVTAGSITGSSTFTTALPAGSRAAGTTAINGNKIQFTVTAGTGNLVWNDAAATGVWDLNTTANFNNGGSNDVFKVSDAVTFDDTIGAGTRNITLTGALSPAQVTVNNSSGDYTLAGAGSLTGGGALVKSGSSKLTLGSAVYGLTGAVTAGGTGTFDLGAKTITPSSLTLSGATLANGTVSSASVDVQSGTSTAVISGSGTLAKTTGGTVTLNAANTYTGGTTVSGGTLVAATGNALGTGTATINAGGTLDLDVGYGLSNTMTVNGGTVAIKRGTTFTVDAPTLVFAGTGGTVTSYAGTGDTATLQGFDVNSTDIQVNTASTGTIDSSVVISTRTYGFRFDVNGTGNLVVAGPITGTGAAAGAVEAGTMIGTDSTAIWKRGSGNLTLTGASTFTAGTSVPMTSIQDGSLTLSGGSNRLPVNSAVYLGNTANTSGKLILNGVDQTITGLAKIGTGTASAVVGASAATSTLTVNNTNDYVFSGSIGGATPTEKNIAIVKSGTGKLTLSGTNTYSGDTTVSGGILSLGAPSLGDASNLRVSDGSVLDLNFSGTDTVGKLYINGLETTAGTWGTSLSGATNKDDIHFTGTGVLNVTGLAAAAYDNWATLKGLDSGNNGKTQDPDNDGVNNFEEFAFDGDPKSGVSDGKTVVKVATVNGQSVLTLTMPIRTNAVFPGPVNPGELVSASVDGVIYHIQAGSNLVTFPFGVDQVLGSDVTSGLPANLPPLTSGWSYRSFYVPGSDPAGNPRIFMRAKVNE